MIGRKEFSANAARFVTALALFSLLAASPPGQGPPADVHLGRGYQLIQDEQWEEASKEFQAALAINPNLVHARYQLAVCLFALGDRERSRQEFERIASEPGIAAMVTYYVGRLDLLSGDNARAIDRLSSIRDAPPFPDTTFYLGCAYLAAGNTEQAITSLERAAAVNPLDFRVHYRLARALEKLGRTAEAEREYAVSTQAREHYNKAARDALSCSQALKTRTLVEARNLCERLFDPNDPDKLTIEGMLYGEAADYVDAIKPLVQASRLDPDSFEVFHNLGLTFFRLHRFEEAKYQLKKAVTLRPDFFGSNALLGATLFMLKQDVEAYTVLTHAHSLNPQNQETSDLLFKEALLLADRMYVAKDYHQATRYLQTAADLQPDNQEVKHKLAELSMLLERNGQRK